MKRCVPLEPAAEKVCDQSSIPPLIFQLPYEEGRQVLEKAQDAPVFKCPADISFSMVNTGDCGSIPVYFVIPKGCGKIENIIFYIHGAGWVFGSFHTHEKLLREQTRANSKTMLMEIVNNVNLTESEKQAAVDKIAELADIAEREMAAENLIASKGYENVVVTVTDDSADVMIVSDSLTDAKRAQIEEIVKTKTNVSADKITITAVKTN